MRRFDCEELFCQALKDGITLFVARDFRYYLVIKTMINYL